MSTTCKPLYSPSELKSRVPLSANAKAFVEKSRNTASEILSGEDPRLLLIIGPCSIHDTTTAKEYATKLKELSLEINDTFFPVMRVYFEKPRTSIGWKGLLHDPFLNGTDQLPEGLTKTRELLSELTEMEVPIGTEFLDPLVSEYIGDFITWGSVGARTTSSQIHRQLASGLPMPVGFKNTTTGDVDTAINACIAAEKKHTYIGINESGHPCSVQTSGNPNTHIVLRGGKDHPNYHPVAVQDAQESLKSQRLTPHLMVDCSHDNSGKLHDKQPLVFSSVIQQIIEGNRGIIGLILESHLKGGKQNFLNTICGKISLTDPCMDWETTKELLLEAKQKLNREKTTPTPAASL